MLTQLSTLKDRLFILPTDTAYDALITTAIKAVSARFDKEANRILARTVDATHEFGADETELLPACYPIESFGKFELKTTEAEGWIQQSTPDYLIRGRCVVSLRYAIAAWPDLARVTYTGG